MKSGKTISMKRLRVLCAAVLATLTALTAVWLRSALAARPQVGLQIIAEEEKRETVYLVPASGKVVRGFSQLTPLWSQTLNAYEIHEGIDLDGGADGMVRACADGQVIAAEEQGGMGLTIVIAHDEGAYSLYASLSALNVQVGNEVRAGQVIGRVGTSAVAERELGAHVHFSFYQGQEIAPPPFTTDEC